MVGDSRHRQIIFPAHTFPEYPSEFSFRTSFRAYRKLRKSPVFVFSVGGGDAERGISANLVSALQYAKQVGARICGIVGRDGGFTARVSDVCVLIPVINPETITPHTESFQALIWHLLVSHPKLKATEMKWESVASPAEQSVA
jgi:D-sedoheptulose 7-phosphate isomerase